MCELGRLLNQDARSLSPRARSPRLRRGGGGGPGSRLWQPRPFRRHRGSAVHPSGRTREPHAGCLRLRLRPPCPRWQPGTQTHRLRAAPRREGDGWEAACPASGQLCPAGRWAAGGRGGGPSAIAGEQSLPKGSSWLGAPVQLALESGTQTSSGALARVFPCVDGGVRSRAPPEPRRLHPSCQTAV